MLHRNRVRIALNHCEPDRVPMDLGSTYVSTIHQTSYRTLLDYLGLEDAEMKVMAGNVNTMVVGDALRERLDVDFIRIGMKPAKNFNPLYNTEDKSFLNEYGIRWKLADAATGIHYPVGHPLAGASSDAIKAYKMPDMTDPSRVEGLRELAKHLYETTDYAIVADGMWLMLQTCYDLVGMEDFMMDLAADRPRARAVLDAVAENFLDSVELFVRAVGDYVDVITFGDDLGTQNGPIFAPSVYRQIVKPYHKLFLETCHRHSRAKVMFHNDGAIAAFLDDAVDVGFDILNPVQCSAVGMDPQFLKKEYGKHLSFWGGIDSQSVMPFGTPEDVTEHVKKMIDIMADGGGYVLGNVHVIEHEIRPENIVALFDTGRSYGQYDEHD